MSRRRPLMGHQAEWARHGRSGLIGRPDCHHGIAPAVIPSPMSTLPPPHVGCRPLFHCASAISACLTCHRVASSDDQTGATERNKMSGLSKVPTALAVMSAIFLLQCNSASAGALSFQGNLDPANPNDVFLTTLTLSSVADLDIQTWGFGGTAGAPDGTNAAGAVIAAGGFDPYVSLFAGAGAGVRSSRRMTTASALPVRHLPLVPIQLLASQTSQRASIRWH
jgi:hypothetical protein